MPLNWATLAAAGWTFHHVNATPLIGGLASLLHWSFALGATYLVAREEKQGAKGVPSAPYGRAAMWAGALHVLGWYMQLHPGHGVFEGRKAALVDALIQSFMDAPLFVWMEVAFYCGWNPALAHQLEESVAVQHAAWARAAA